MTRPQTQLSTQTRISSQIFGENGLSLLLAVVVVAAAVAGFVVKSPALVVVPALGLAAAKHWRRSSTVEQARQQVIDDLPPFVDAVIQQLKAGGSLSQALQTTNGTDAIERHLRPFRLAVSSGASVGPALRRLQSSVEMTANQAPGLLLVINAAVVLTERGGRALPSLERLNDTLRSAQWIESEVRTQAGQAMASAVVLAALPAIFVIGLTVADRRLAQFYLRSTMGSGCLVAAGIGSYGGLWWMRRLIRTVT